MGEAGLSVWTWIKEKLRQGCRIPGINWIRIWRNFIKLHDLFCEPSSPDPPKKRIKNPLIIFILDQSSNLFDPQNVSAFKKMGKRIIARFLMHKMFNWRKIKKSIIKVFLYRKTQWIKVMSSLESFKHPFFRTLQLGKRENSYSYAFLSLAKFFPPFFLNHSVIFCCFLKKN